MPKIFDSKCTFGRMTKSQVTVDLPDNVTAPAEIDLAPSGGEKYAQLSIYVANEFYMTLADDATEAGTRIAADTSRCLLPAGFYGFPCVGNTEKFYLRSSGAAAVTDGVRYQFIEATDEGGY